VVSAVEEKGMKTVEAMRVFGVGQTALFGWSRPTVHAGSGTLLHRGEGNPRVNQS
jgi:hypothetical protein